MKWKRCGSCKDLKPVEKFWRKGDGYQSRCIDCMKAEYQENKEKKKEYDKQRYEKNKAEDKEEYVCMRCDEFVANVKNNAMYWCFHCLSAYEKEWKQKIVVEVINPVIRRSKYFKEKQNAIQKENKREAIGDKG